MTTPIPGSTPTPQPLPPIGAAPGGGGERPPTRVLSTDPPLDLRTLQRGSLNRSNGVPFETTFYNATAMAIQGYVSTLNSMVESRDLQSKLAQTYGQLSRMGAASQLAASAAEAESQRTAGIGAFTKLSANFASGAATWHMHTMEKNTQANNKLLKTIPEMKKQSPAVVSEEAPLPEGVQRPPPLSRLDATKAAEKYAMDPVKNRSQLDTVNRYLRQPGVDRDSFYQHVEGRARESNRQNREGRRRWETQRELLSSTLSGTIEGATRLVQADLELAKGRANANAALLQGGMTQLQDSMQLTGSTADTLGKAADAIMQSALAAAKAQSGAA